MTWMSERTGVRREYKVLYGVGPGSGDLHGRPRGRAAHAAGGDEFFSALSVGRALVLLNQNLCDCFLEYAEITSKMAMLLAFVSFGAGLSGITGDWATRSRLSCWLCWSSWSSVRTSWEPYLTRRA